MIELLLNGHELEAEAQPVPLDVVIALLLLLLLLVACQCVHASVCVDVCRQFVVLRLRLCAKMK